MGMIRGTKRSMGIGGNSQCLSSALGRAKHFLFQSASMSKPTEKIEKAAMQMPGDIAVAGIGNCNLKFKFAAAQAKRHLN